MANDIWTMINQSKKPTGKNVHSVSFRLDKKENDRLNKFVEENHLDKTIFLRNAVFHAMEEYNNAKIQNATSPAPTG